MPPNEPYLGAPVHDPQGVLGRLSTSMGEGPMSAILMELARRAMAQQPQPAISAGPPHTPTGQAIIDRSIAARNYAAQGGDTSRPVALWQQGQKGLAVSKALMEALGVGVGASALAASAPILAGRLAGQSLTGGRGALGRYFGMNPEAAAEYGYGPWLGAVGTAYGVGAPALLPQVKFNLPGPSGIID